MVNPMDLEDDLQEQQRTTMVPEEEDEIVAELDVYRALPPPGASLYLLQFPLRGEDRSHDHVQRVRLKPNVKRMEWMIPLDRSSDTYNSHAEAPELQSLTGFSLQSSRVDPEVSGLSACMRIGDDLYLTPVSEVLQLRHSPAYLDKEKEKTGREKAAANSKDPKEPEVKEELAPITVQVKRHETEQQTEARLRSYAFHAQKEEADNWVELHHHAIPSNKSRQKQETIARSVANAPHPKATMQRMAFLEAITPGPSALAPTPGADDGADGGGGGVTDALGRPANQLSAAQSLPEEVVNDLMMVVRNWLNSSQVLTLDNVRMLVSKLKNRDALVAAITEASDAALSAALLSSGELLTIRQRYIRRTLGDANVDPLRNAVLDLLNDKESIKRNDVSAQAESNNIVMTDALYNKVMKEICVSKGSVWSLKPGITIPGG